MTGRTFGLAATALLIAVPAMAQSSTGGQSTAARADAALATADSTTVAPSGRMSTQPAITMQHFRAQDQRGLNVFEPPKHDNVPYTGFRLDWGAAFAQQFQSMDHSNSADPRVVNGVNANQLAVIGAGFNNANANLYLNAQLAPGIRLALSTYLSSRHHPETWVKDGYVLMDASPIDMPVLHTIMDYVTLRVGHFEINYGDAHFRRTDNGNALYNPFVGNYIMDAFTTEIGAEAYFRTGPFMAMVGATGGEIRGQVLRPDDRGMTILAKAGVDQQVNPDLRVRLTGSMYSTDKSISNTLYGGDRAGSRYYYVLENTAAAEASQFTSGLLNPGFRSSVRAFQVNPFVKFQGLELFGVAEKAEGRAGNETADRSFNQYAVDAVYRFLADEMLFVGARYNTVNGRLQGMANDVSIDRTAFGAGWFVTPSLLLKGEYVTQKYNDFPLTDIRRGGRFNGLTIEGVLAF
jgi:hypothetical protein